MNAKQRKAVALNIAYAAVMSAIDSGQAFNHTDSDDDYGKIQDEFEAIAQRLFERWERANSSLKQEQE